MSCQVPVPAFWDPGACSINCDICRPLTGNPATSRSPTLTPIRAELTSRIGATPTTVIASWTPAGFSSKSRFSSWPTAIRISVYSICANPSFVTRMVYVDGLRLAIRNTPLSEVACARSSPVRSFFTVTAAPATMPPLLSRTVPANLP